MIASKVKFCRCTSRTQKNFSNSWSVMGARCKYV